MHGTYFVDVERSMRVYRRFREHESAERARRCALSPEQRLDEPELLRIEAGTFLCAYPAGFRRAITVTRREHH